MAPKGLSLEGMRREEAQGHPWLTLRTPDPSWWPQQEGKARQLESYPRADQGFAGLEHCTARGASHCVPRTSPSCKHLEDIPEVKGREEGL